MARRLLLTCFDPFDGTGLNSSQETLRAVAARRPELATAVLPSRYGDDVAALEAALAAARPDAVLLTGQLTGSPLVRVERLAVNVRFADSQLEVIREPDAPQQLIEPDGPAARFAAIPPEPLAAAIAARGVTVTISNHGGIYLCNHVLYHALARGHYATFLHLPALAEQWAACELPPPPNLPDREALVTAVEAALDHLAG